MAPALVEANLGPKYLIQQHYAEAERELGRLRSLKAAKGNVAPPLEKSGPQGNLQPFTLVEDPSAWYAADVKARSDWIHVLTAEDIKEIDSALRLIGIDSIRKQGNLLHIQEKVPTKEHFPLPTLGPKLQSMRNEVVWGRGFQLIRGLPVEKYSREEVVAIYWGFGLWWGKVVSQNAKGHIVGHVKNIGHGVDAPNTRVYATPLPQPWHNDSSDVVALLCLKTAKEGGQSSWASAISIHNEMLKHGRRDLVEEFTKPIWWVDRKGEVPEGKSDVYQLPIFHYHKGYLSCAYQDTWYQLAQRHAYVPRLTEKQKEALRVFNALANSDEIRMDFNLQPGDIQLLNNLTQQHQRSSYVDHEDINEKRHLLRLWVSPEENRPLPEEFAELWNNTTPGERGGINVRGQLLTVPLEAE